MIMHVVYVDVCTLNWANGKGSLPVTWVSSTMFDLSDLLQLSCPDHYSNLFPVDLSDL